MMHGSSQRLCWSSRSKHLVIRSRKQRPQAPSLRAKAGSRTMRSGQRSTPVTSNGAQLKVAMGIGPVPNSPPVKQLKRMETAFGTARGRRFQSLLGWSSNGLFGTRCGMPATFMRLRTPRVLRTRTGLARHTATRRGWISTTRRPRPWLSSLRICWSSSAGRPKWPARPPRGPPSRASRCRPTRSRASTAPGSWRRASGRACWGPSATRPRRWPAWASRRPSPLIPSCSGSIGARRARPSVASRPSGTRSTTRPRRPRRRRPPAARSSSGRRCGRPRGQRGRRPTGRRSWRGRRRRRRRW
mmetsp:Transcript_107550/g.304118  ORF Transcript_107550/g.304118 Transcript_107550/m.304118 type:complete len:300 (+) Transcript_107550:151-1050(+)